MPDERQLQPVEATAQGPRLDALRVEIEALHPVDRQELEMQLEFASLERVPITKDLLKLALIVVASGLLNGPGWFDETSTLWQALNAGTWAALGVYIRPLMRRSFLRDRFGKSPRSDQVTEKLMVAALACGLFAGCGLEDVTGPGPGPRCEDKAPAAAGTWEGTLGTHILKLELTEKCESSLGVGLPPVSGPDTWHLSGRWSWGELLGPVLGGYDAKSHFLGVLLPQDSSPVWYSGVRILVDGFTPPADSVLQAYAVERWTATRDTTRVVASFDSVPVVLRRRR